MAPARKQDAPAGETGANDEGTTVDRILRSAIRHFGEKGLEGARIERIAEDAGVSKQLIYHYFGGKEDIYSEILNQISSQNYALLMEIDFEALDPREAVRQFLVGLRREYEGSPLSASVTLDQMLHSGAQIRRNPKADRMRAQLLARLDAVVERGRQQGLFNDRVTATALHVMGVVIMHGSHSYPPLFCKYAAATLGAEETQPDYWRDYAVEFFLSALRA